MGKEPTVIDILIPVLSRPQNAAPLVQNIRAVTTVPHEIIFLCTEGDDAQIIACEATDAAGHILDGPAGPGDYAKKINRGARVSSEWIFMGADDITFEPRWDTNALKVARDKYDVVATNDMANAYVRRGQFGTHCLIRRRYITEMGGTADGEPGVVLWEGYDHNFVDRELSHVAQARGRFAFARHSIVRHRHPLWRTAPDDSTYRKALKNFRADQKLFLSRAHLWGYEGLSGPERKMAA
jgi:hypothetical protein